MPDITNIRVNRTRCMTSKRFGQIRASMVCHGGGSTYRCLWWTFRQMTATVRGVLGQLFAIF